MFSWCVATIYQLTGQETTSVIIFACLTSCGVNNLKTKEPYGSAPTYSLLSVRECLSVKGHGGKKTQHTVLCITVCRVMSCNIPLHHLDSITKTCPLSGLLYQSLNTPHSEPTFVQVQAPVQPVGRAL